MSIDTIVALVLKIVILIYIIGEYLFRKLWDFLTEGNISSHKHIKWSSTIFNFEYHFWMNISRWDTKNNYFSSAIESIMLSYQLEYT